MTDKKQLTRDILPTAATMLGVCITTISLLKILEHLKTQAIVDEILEFDSLIFMLSALISFYSMRQNHNYQKLEALAETIFLIGLIVMSLAIITLGLTLPSFPARY